MKILFDYDDNNLNIPIKLPLNFTDRCDGVADTMSFDFMYNNDLIQNYHKLSKCRVKVYDNNDVLVKEYRMVISDINRALNSMDYSNTAFTYTYSVTLTEPSVLFRECIKTDIAITPYLYPVSFKDFETNYYSTLWDAYIKVLSCHNLVTRNEKIYAQYEDTTSREYQLKQILSEVPCPSLTFVDLNTFSQLQDLFNRVGLIPYIDFDWETKHCFMDFYKAQGELNEQFDMVALQDFSSQEISKTNDTSSEAVSTFSSNTIMDTDYVVYPTQFTNTILPYPNMPIEATNDFIILDNMTATDISDFIKGQGTITLNEETYGTQKINIALFNNYNNNAEAIKQANEYSIHLPTNVENILAVYACNLEEDMFDSMSGGGTYGLGFKKIKENRLIEYSAWKQLTNAQQKLFSYFVRGENEIKQAVCLTSASKSDFLNNFDWSATFLYRILRQTIYIVVYKPMIDTTYISYTEDTANSSSTKIINLPYKLTSDKQVGNILNYEINKESSNIISFKQVTKSIGVLNRFAGEKVYYQKIALKESNYIGLFASYNILKTSSSATLTNESWAKVGTQPAYTIYKYNFENGIWENYIGDLCVITKLNITINNTGIDITYELSDKVAKNSSFSDYSDNVRISDNISSLNAVYRDVTMNKTFYTTINYLDSINYGLPNLPINISYNPNTIPDLKGIDCLLYGCGLWKLGFTAPDEMILGGTDVRTQVFNRINNLNLLHLGVKKEGYSRTFKETIELTPDATTNYRYSYDKNNGILTLTIYSIDGQGNIIEKSTDWYFDLSTPLKARVYDFTATSDVYSGYENARFTPVDNVNNVETIIRTKEDMEDYINMIYANGFANYTRIEYDSFTTIKYIQFPLFYYIDNEVDTYSPINSLSNYYSLKYVPIFKTRLFTTTFDLYSIGLTTDFMVNNNPIWLTSDNYTMCNFPYSEASIQGNYGNANISSMLLSNKIVSSNPILYTESTTISTLDNIANYDTASSFGNTSFYDYLLPYGYTDIKVDVREILVPHIQYLTLKERGENIKNNYSSLFIEELNSNISYNYNVFPKVESYIDDRNTNVRIYTIPFGATINDYLNTPNMATLYCTASCYLRAYNNPPNTPLVIFGMIDNFRDTIGYETVLVEDLTKNYLITIKDNNKNIETPLAIVKGYGWHNSPTNNPAVALTIGARLD